MPSLSKRVQSTTKNAARVVAYSKFYQRLNHHKLNEQVAVKNSIVSKSIDVTKINIDYRNHYSSPTLNILHYPTTCSRNLNDDEDLVTVLRPFTNHNRPKTRNGRDSHCPNITLSDTQVAHSDIDSSVQFSFGGHIPKTFIVKKKRYAPPLKSTHETLITYSRNQTYDFRAEDSKKGRTLKQLLASPSTVRNVVDV